MTTTGVRDTRIPPLAQDDSGGHTGSGTACRLMAAAQHVAQVAETTAGQHDREMSFPAAPFEAIASTGLLAAPLSHKQGGAELDASTEGRLLLLNVLRTIGYGDLSTGRIYEGHVNALQLAQSFATPEQYERWSADARDHGMIFAVWNTEAGDGVRLVPVPGGMRLEGSKTFASGAGHLQRPIITGALPDGSRQMCVVPMERVDVTIDRSWWNPLGMRASISHRIDFTGAVIERDDLLGAPGDYHRQPWFGAGAIRFAAVQLGGAEALLDATRDVLRSLGRTGDPYQQARIGEAALRVESGRHWLNGAADHVRLGPDADGAVCTERSLAYANMMRTAIEAICLDVTGLAVRSAGARVLVQPHPVERIIRDLTVYLRQPAPDAALAHIGALVLESDRPIGTLWENE
jgi:alkylation response protein AidB-like acyl-CoA dehydrogenase